MAEDILLVEKKDYICTLTINRPEVRNSLSPELLAQMGDLFTRLKDDPEVRVVVIRGAGEKAFSAGFDIGRIEGVREQSQEEKTHEHPLDYPMEAITAYPFPVIAMIYGFCAGAGLELASTCDLRLAAQNARLGITPAKLGIVYAYAGVQRVVNVVGVAGAKELFFTGRLIDAQRARQIGLVDWVVPEEELTTVTYDLAREIASNAPLSVSAAKITINKLTKPRPLSPDDEAELMGLWAKAMQSEDLQEGQRAFMEKRKPVFRGR